MFTVFKLFFTFIFNFIFYNNVITIITGYQLYNNREFFDVKVHLFYLKSSCKERGGLVITVIKFMVCVQGIYFSYQITQKINLSDGNSLTL